jgi:hypothetical protein
MLQTGMKSMLELAYQLDFIDYQQPNFVHADMSPDAFSKSMQDRGESIWTMLFRMMGQGIAQQGGKQSASDIEVLVAMFSNNRPLALKRLLARQFEDLEGAMGMFEGPDGSTIISERNKRALEVLEEQIAAGKKRVAIFYGAGHMPDMEKRLLADFGLKRQGEHWLEAWNLRSPAKKVKKDGAKEESAEETPAAQPNFDGEPASE